METAGQRSQNSGLQAANQRTAQALLWGGENTFGSVCLFTHTVIQVRITYTAINRVFNRVNVMLFQWLLRRHRLISGCSSNKKPQSVQVRADFRPVKKSSDWFNITHCTHLIWLQVPEVYEPWQQLPSGCSLCEYITYVFFLNLDGTNYFVVRYPFCCLPTKYLCWRSQPLLGFTYYVSQCWNG